MKNFDDPYLIYFIFGMCKAFGLKDDATDQDLSDFILMALEAMKVQRKRAK